MGSRGGRERPRELELNNTRRCTKTKIGVSQNEVKLYEAKLAKAKAIADLAKAELNFTKVKAPFDGIVDLLKQQGSLVSEGENIATLSDNSIVRVYFNVPETRYLEHMADVSQPRNICSSNSFWRTARSSGMSASSVRLRLNSTTRLGPSPSARTFRTRIVCCVTVRVVRANRVRVLNDARKRSGTESLNRILTSLFEEWLDGIKRAKRKGSGTESLNRFLTPLFAK